MINKQLLLTSYYNPIIDILLLCPYKLNNYYFRLTSVFQIEHKIPYRLRILSYGELLINLFNDSVDLIKSFNLLITLHDFIFE